MSEALKTEAPDTRPWWMQLSRYHWYVFALCAMGWLFDTMDQKIFTTSRQPAMESFLPHVTSAEKADITFYGGIVTSVFILGWATGGLIFGILGDKWGRAKTMALTILVYAFFTGFSALAQNWWEFAIFRFLTGLGVGGEFAAGVALLAEVIPSGARSKALGMLQALSAVGNILGATLFGYIEPWLGWKQLYFVGAAPALLAVFVRFGMKEPDKWLAAKAESEAALARGEDMQMGGLSAVFSHPKWRRNALAGMSLAISGVIALWSIGFYLPELIRTVVPDVAKETRPLIQKALDAKDLSAQNAEIAKLTAVQHDEWVVLAKSVETPELNADGSLKAALSENSSRDLNLVLYRSNLIKNGENLQQVGAFIGMLFFAYFAARFGRRLSFFIAFILAWGSVIYIMTQFKRPTDIYYMWPIMGFCMLLPFGGYAIYFPELFPTRLRTTGTGLCYNVGRYVAATGPILLGYLAKLFEGNKTMHPFRIAALIVSSCYLIGLVALIWAPETVNQPLPEEERGFAH